MPELKVKEEHVFYTAVEFTTFFEIEDVFKKLFDESPVEYVTEEDDTGEMIRQLIAEAFPDWAYTIFVEDGNEALDTSAAYTIRIFETHTHAKIVKEHCPRCGTPMEYIDSEKAGPASDLHYYNCSKCDREFIVQTWDNGQWSIYPAEECTAGRKHIGGS